MFEGLGARLRDWDALTGTAEWRWGGVGIGLCAGGLLLLAPTPEGLELQAHRTAAVALVMALWWVGGVLPMALTAVVPLFVFPMIGLGTLGEVAAAWAHPLNLLMAGGFVLAVGMERAGVHERLTAFDGRDLDRGWSRSELLRAAQRLRGEEGVRSRTHARLAHSVSEQGWISTTNQRGRRSRWSGSPPPPTGFLEVLVWVSK